MYLQNCARSRQMLLGAITLQNAAGEELDYRCEGAVIEPAGESSPAKIFMRFKTKDAASAKFNLLAQKIEELNKEIFERKRAEEESHRLYREATAANNSKDEFLAIVSHELRAPLNSILGWARLLQTNQIDAEQTAKALETIERSARSQAQLIDDLLDVSRIITGKLRLDVRPVEIVALIESAIETIRPTSDNKSVRLRDHH